MIGHLRYLGLLLPLFTFSSSAAAQHSAVHIAPAGSQIAVYGPAENFTGRVRVDPLFKADNDIRVSAAYVTFEPGARSAWHTHPAGQRLIVTSGVGLTQQAAGAGHPHWRCCLLSGGRQTLARSCPRQCNDASGDNRDCGWQKR